MTLPDLTAQQRNDALQKAVHARTLRTTIKHRIGAGELPVTDVINSTGVMSDLPADDHAIIGKTKVIDVIQSVHGIGKTKALRIMQTCNIAPNRRLRGLGPRQRKQLTATLSHD